MYMDLSIKEFPDELMEKIDKLAEQQKRSRSQQIIWMLELEFNTKVRK